VVDALAGEADGVVDTPTGEADGEVPQGLRWPEPRSVPNLFTETWEEREESEKKEREKGERPCRRGESHGKNSGSTASWKLRGKKEGSYS
jgi:hypothetical protein